MGLLVLQMERSLERSWLTDFVQSRIVDHCFYVTIFYSMASDNEGFTDWWREGEGRVSNSMYKKARGVSESPWNSEEQDDFEGGAMESVRIDAWRRLKTVTNGMDALEVNSGNDLGLRDLLEECICRSVEKARATFMTSDGRVTIVRRGKVSDIFYSFNLVRKQGGRLVVTLSERGVVEFGENLIDGRRESISSGDKVITSVVKGLLNEILGKK